MEKSAVVFVCNSFLSDESCILQGRKQSSSLRIIKKDLPTKLCFSQFPTVGFLTHLALAIFRLFRLAAALIWCKVSVFQLLI